MAGQRVGLFSILAKYIYNGISVPKNKKNILFFVEIRLNTTVAVLTNISPSRLASLVCARYAFN